MKRILFNERDNFQWKCQRYFHCSFIYQEDGDFWWDGFRFFLVPLRKQPRKLNFSLWESQTEHFPAFGSRKQNGYPSSYHHVIISIVPIYNHICNHHHRHCPPYMAARDHKAKQGPDSWCEASRSLTFSSSFALQTIGIGIIMSVIADLLPHLYH